MIELLNCLNLVSAAIQRVDQENRLINRFTARDFTPFRFYNRWGEVPSTKLLAFFLDASEDHGQGTLFQDIFFDRLRQQHPLLKNRIPNSRWAVEAERGKGEFGRPDLLFVNAERSFGICIENKPRDQTRDQPQQLSSYRKYLQLHHQENYLLIYLTSVERPPVEDSLPPATVNTLRESGHYVNLTFHDFILPLLDEWHQAVHPENLRIFLRQFRYQVEQWLQFDSTKPAQLMQDQEIVAALATNPSFVRTAFDISASMAALKFALLEKLSKDLSNSVEGLIGASHWKDMGFFNSTERKPFLIRRPSPDGSTKRLPWGRFSIGLEFDQQSKLFYGIRYDKANWHQTEATVDSVWPAEAPADIAKLLGTESQEWEWWPWWAWAGPGNDKDLYSSIADGALYKKLAPEIARLATALNTYCNTSV